MDIKDLFTKALVAALEIPPSAYEKAHGRYRDLGEWFDREESSCADFSPHIYPQGSFRLGTVIRPVDANGSYDLDVGCRMREGIEKNTHTQFYLKQLVRAELEAYLKARNIKSPLEEKHRCWTVYYSDELNFSMDVVPSIPEDQANRAVIRNRLIEFGSDQGLAEEITQHTGAITDDRHPGYKIIVPDWRISNSEGFAIWFESRIRQCLQRPEEVSLEAKARVDNLPAWEWKSPLQEAVQILKHHRDNMFRKAPKSKPISVILTTLAGWAYTGEPTTALALSKILHDMDRFVSDRAPRVQNPVNAAEDFADKWHDPNCAHLRLEENFKEWLKAARRDFAAIDRLSTADQLEKHAEINFGVRVTGTALTRFETALSGTASQNRSPYVISERPPRPWCA